MPIRPYLQIFIMLIFLLAESWAFNTATSPKVEELRLTLDSLELQIQNKRRNGESIDKLVREVETVKSAIEKENVRIEKSGVASGSSKNNDSDPTYTLPTSTIDWMIIVVGAVAAIAGLLLFVLQIIYFFKKRKKKEYKKVKPVTYSSAKQLQKTNSHTEKAPVEKTTVSAPDWVSAMRSFEMQTGKSQPTDVTVQPSPETIKTDAQEKVPAQNAESFDEGERSSELIMEEPAFENQMLDDLGLEEVFVSTEPQIDNGADSLVSDLLKPRIEDQKVEEHLEAIEKFVEEVVESEEVTELQENTPKTRAQQVKELILEKFDSGKSSVEIAREVGMSVGEVDLILTLARRM